MKLPERLGFKLYFLFFTWVCLGELVALILPEAENYIYYHTLQALLPTTVMFYHYALLRVLVDLICLVPLLAYAFKWKPMAGWFWRPLFLTRIATDLIGHNYELQTFKSAFYGDRGVFIATLIVYGLFLVPSYYAHYAYAFPKTKKDDPSRSVLASG
jgi:hypothetical protein